VQNHRAIHYGIINATTKMAKTPMIHPITIGQPMKNVHIKQEASRNAAGLYMPDSNTFENKSVID
jgi:hypothetical protein